MSNAGNHPVTWPLSTAWTDPHRGRVAAWEAASVLLVLGVFLCALLFTMARLSLPWWDEVQGAEVAANLLQGHGFTSGASLIHTKHQFYATNAPLFHYAMFLWIQVFGFSAQAVRSFDYVLATLIVAAVWAAVARLKLVVTPQLRILLVVLLCCGLSMSRVYLNNRYDCAGILVIALMLLVLTLHRRKYRIPLLLAGSILLPFLGIHLVAYLGLLCLIVLFLLGRSAWKEIASVALGSALGLGGLLLLWLYQGAWASFLAGAQFDAKTFQTGWPRLRMFVHGVLLYQLNDTDILAAGLALGLLSPTVRRGLKLRSALAVGLLCTLGIPLAMTIIGRYAGVYAWMAFIPVSVCAVAAIERDLACSRLWSFVQTALVLVACLLGVPAKVALSAMEWSARDYAQVERFVSQYVQPSDRVYCAFAAYYPAKKLAQEIWVGCGWAQMSPQEKADLSLIITEPAKRGQTMRIEGPSTEAALQALAGQWRFVDRYVTRRTPLGTILWPGFTSPSPKEAEIYDLEVYRKVQEPELPGVGGPPAGQGTAVPR